MCVNTMSRRKNISNDQREAVVADHQSGKGYKAISKLFGVHHLIVRKNIHKWKTFKIAVNLPSVDEVDVPVSSPKVHIVQCSDKSQTLQASVSIC